MWGGSRTTADATKAARPAELPERIAVLVEFLREGDAAVTTEALTAAFTGATSAEVELSLLCASAAQAITRTDAGWITRA